MKKRNAKELRAGQADGLHAQTAWQSGAWMPAQDGVQRAEGLGNAAEQFTLFSDPIDATGGAVDGVGSYVAAQADDDHPERAHQAGGLSSAAAGASMVTSGVTAVAGFVGLVDNIRNLASKERRANMDGFEIADEGFAAAQNTIQGASGLAITASNAGGFGATVAATADDGLDAAATAAQGFQGLGAGLETVSGSAQLLLSTARTITGVVSNINAHRKGKDTDWTAVGTDALGILKGALSTAESCVTAISAFTSIAGKVSELANVLPIVGAAVNIAIQLVDIAIQVINGTKHLIKLVQAKVRQKKLEGYEEKSTDADEKQLYGDVADVNRKRFNREILPVCTAVINTVADLISIGGSVLNIVGTATAPAYGAGVAIMAGGYSATAVGGLMKVGTALAGPFAAAVRKTKQASNDVRAGEGKGASAWLVRKTGISKVVGDETKSTSKKEARYLDDAHKLFAQMAKLPAYNDADRANVAAYDRMRYVVKATGVNMKGLRMKAQEGNYQEAVELVVEALKVRG